MVIENKLNLFVKSLWLLFFFYCLSLVFLHFNNVLTYWIVDGFMFFSLFLLVFFIWYGAHLENRKEAEAEAQAEREAEVMREARRKKAEVMREARKELLLKREAKRKANREKGLELFEGKWFPKEEAKNMNLFKTHQEKLKEFFGCEIKCRACSFIWVIRKKRGLPARCSGCGEKERLVIDWVRSWNNISRSENK